MFLLFTGFEKDFGPRDVIHRALRTVKQSYILQKSSVCSSDLHRLVRSRTVVLTGNRRVIAFNGATNKAKWEVKYRMSTCTSGRP